MAPRVNRLRDVKVEAISIVRKGANGKRICLFKSGDEEPETTFDFPEAKIAKAEDWSAFYITVAEPGWLENPGMYGEAGTLDVWESEQEIRKAAHRFLKNGALINKMHEDMEPFGELVESAVALTDIPLVGETISKGSWYIAIEPTDEGKRAVDAGEFTGVSIQGSGVRLGKTETFSKPGTSDVTPSDRKKIAPLASHYLSKPHPFTACVRDQVKHGLSEDHANRRCAVLLDSFDPTRARHSVSKSELDEARETLNGLPEDVGYGDLHDTLDGVDQSEKIGFIQKLGEFFGLTVPEDAISKADDATLGSDPQEEQKMDTEIKDRFEGLESKLGKMADAIEKLAPEGSSEEKDDKESKLAKQVEELLNKVKEREEENSQPSPEELKKSVDELIEKVGDVVQAVDAMAEGDSTTGDPERVEKKDPSPLSGILD